MISWKSGERRIAKILGCERIPVTGRRRKDAPSDLVSGWLAVECKTTKRMPRYLANAMNQAEAGAAHFERKDSKPRLAIAVIHEDSSEYLNSVVCLRLRDFVEFFGGDEAVA